MPGDYFWNCLEALAAMFAGDHEAVETNLDIYERHLRRLPLDQQEFMRHDIDLIVAALARLSARLRDDPPRRGESA
jgi:hypothetical protein